MSFLDAAWILTKCFLLLVTYLCGDTLASVGICAVVRDETKEDLQEWLTYHESLGFSKIYIFDDRSVPPLDTLISGRNVKIISLDWELDATFTKGRSPQTWAYERCLNMFGNLHSFILFIDADEFVFYNGTLEGKTVDLPTFVDAYHQAGLISIHWRLFGPSGHFNRPKASVLCSYDEYIPGEDMHLLNAFRANPLGHMKSFVNTKFVAGSCNAHMCQVSSPAVMYDFTKLTPLTARVVLCDRLCIYHYVTKSLEDFLRKLNRGSVHSQYVTGRHGKDVDYFLSINKLARARLNSSVAFKMFC